MLQSMRSAARYIWWFVAAMFLIGFVFYQQSGLSDRTITAGSTVAKVNGTSITYENWSRALRDRIQEAQQRSGKTPQLRTARSAQRSGRGYWGVARRG